MNFVSFPSCLKQHVLLFCNVKELIRCCELSKSLKENAQDAAKAILSAIALKYYDDFPQREQWLVSAPPFALFREILEEKTYILRGFALYSLNMRTRTWTRCTDCARDRLQAGLQFKGGFMYAVGTESVVASGTVEKYNPLTDRWVAVAPYPPGTGRRATVNHNEKLYLFVGNGVANEATAENRIYVFSSSESGTEAWQQLSMQLPHVLLFFTPVSFKGKIWIIVSMFGTAEIVGTYIYDTEAGTMVLGPAVDFAKLATDVFVTDDAIYVLASNLDHRHFWMKCSDEQGQWEVLHYVTKGTTTALSAIHGDRVTCFYPSGKPCDAFNLTTGLWDSDQQATAGGAGAGGHNATHIVVPQEVLIDNQCSAIGYSPRRFTWG